MRFIEDRMMPLMLLLLLSSSSLPAATFVLNMTAYLPPSYNLSYFASFVLEDPPLLTHSIDYHEHTFEGVTGSSPVFTPQASYQANLAYLDSANFYDGLELRILGPFLTTMILCGNGFQFPVVTECGPFVYRRHVYNPVTSMWESELDLMRTLQGTPTMFFMTNEVPPYAFGPAFITVRETPEPSTWFFVASATLALHLLRQRRYSIRQ